MAAIYNDGTVVYGSRSWAIKQNDGTTARGTYVCDTISISRPTKAIDRTNQLGEPSGSVGIADFVTGSATLQFSSTAVTEPRSGDKIICNGTTNAVLDSGIGTETFYITSVSRAESKDAETKLTINFKKSYA